MSRAARVTCQVSIHQTGYEMVILESDVFRLVILPSKGTDLIELLHKPSQTDFMWWTALGLKAATEPPSDFQSQYQGGWQEIFPNLGSSHIHNGVSLRAYGEVCLLPWSYKIVIDQPDHVAVCFYITLHDLQFKLEKTIHLRNGMAGFEFKECATSLANTVQHADWGQHITFGEPFLTPGTTLELPSPTRPSFTIPERGTAGGFEALDDITQGMYRLIRPDGLRVQISWDASLWSCLWFWRDFAGENVAPYFGQHFNIGLEMFSSKPAERLQDNINLGTALRFEAGQTRASWLRFEVIDAA